MTSALRPLLMLLATLAALACACRPATAQTDVMAKAYTTGEQARLPEWCIDSQDGPYGSPEGGAGLNRSPRAAKWVALMGVDFWNLHHYCRGLRDMLRLNGTVLSLMQQRALQERAINEFEYVVKTCRPTMPLMPEVMLKMGDAHVMLGNLLAASEAFEAARKLKPDYWPAYDHWAVVLIRLKRQDTARALLQEGLAQSPGEPNLSARLASLGRPSTASPVAAPPRPTAEPAAAASSAVVTGTGPTASASATASLR